MRRRAIGRLAALALLLCVALAAAPRPDAGAPPALAPRMDMLVTTAWLAAHLHDRGVVLLHVDKPPDATRLGPLYKNGHIPGARELDFGSIIERRGAIEDEMPSEDSLRKVFEARGISDSTHVILTGGPRMVARTYFTLIYLGVEHVSVLLGGTTQWRHESRPMGGPRAETPVARGHITATAHPEFVAHRDWLLARLGKSGISIIDTRSPDEYSGVGDQRWGASTGHIEGARRLDSEDFFTDDSEFTLKSIPELQRLIRTRAHAGDTVVAYCKIGYRSAATFFVARLLGYDAMLFDGSYEDWFEAHYPTVTAPTPLIAP